MAKRNKFHSNKEESEYNESKKIIVTMLISSVMLIGCRKEQIVTSSDLDSVLTNTSTTVSVEETVVSEVFVEEESEEALVETPVETMPTTEEGESVMSEAKMLREQTRTQNKESLLEIINSTQLTDEQKQEAVGSIVQVVEYAEVETVTEILLESKGFSDVVVSINADVVEVVVNAPELTDAQRTQIEDVVIRKTDYAAENIVISTVAEEATASIIPTGESVLSGAKLSREQTRTQNKEILMAIINNTQLTYEQKQEAVDSMVQMTEYVEMEADVEIFLESKGFTDVIVYIGADGVDVVVNALELEDVQRAQIEDVVIRKTMCVAENIVISTVEQ